MREPNDEIQNGKDGDALSDSDLENVAGGTNKPAQPKARTPVVTGGGGADDLIKSTSFEDNWRVQR
jgi:hypothetical protein